MIEQKHSALLILHRHTKPWRPTNASMAIKIMVGGLEDVGYILTRSVSTADHTLALDQASTATDIPIVSPNTLNEPWWEPKNDKTVQVKKIKPTADTKGEGGKSRKVAKGLAINSLELKR